MSIPASLDPRLVKMLEMVRASSFENERAVARAKAETLAVAVGGVDRALRILAFHKARAAAPGNFLAGFDEFDEIDNPGTMARKADARAERRRREDERRAVLVAEFGSLEAVLKPCLQEKAIIAAVKPWRVTVPGSRGRWTQSLAGLGLYDNDKAPADLVAAIEGAFPMPSSYAEAKAEMAFWERRNVDMELAASDDFRGDYMLDTPALWRWWLVRGLAEHRMELRTLSEIIERLRLYRQDEGGTNTRVEDAILRDLEALAAREAR